MLKNAFSEISNLMSGDFLKNAQGFSLVATRGVIKFVN